MNAIDGLRRVESPFRVQGRRWRGGGDQIERIDYVLLYIESIESNDEVYLLLLSLAC